MAPIQEGQGETQERGRPLQIGRYWFYQARALTYKACLGRPLNESITTLALHNLRSLLYMGLNSVQSYCPDGLNNTLPSQSCIFGNSTHCGKVGQKAQFKDQEELRSLQSSETSLRVNWWPQSPNDLLQQLVRAEPGLKVKSVD